MSHGTQLDLFEPLDAIDEIKSALKGCARLMTEIQSISSQQQMALSRLYLTLKKDAEKQAQRVKRMEKI